MHLFLPRKGAAFFVWGLAFLSFPSFGADSVDQLILAEHWKRARVIVEQRVRANPKDAQAFCFLSKIEESFGNIGAAVNAAEQSVYLDGGSAQAHAQLAEVDALMAEQTGLMKQIGYVRKMRRELDAAFAIDARQLDAQLVEIMFSWKAPLLAGGDRAKALRLVEALKHSHPVWGYLVEARLFETQDPGRAQKALEHAEQTNPQFYRARVALAKFYIENQNRPADAERVAKSAVALDPEQAGAYGVLARIYGMQGRYEELQTILEEAERRVPDDLSPYFFAARALVANSRDAQRAQQYIQKYMTQQPEARAPGMSEARTLLAAISKPVARAANRTADPRTAPGPASR